MLTGRYEDIPTMVREALGKRISLMLIESEPGTFKIIPMDTRDRDNVRAYIAACGIVVESVIAKRVHRFSLPDLGDGVEVVRV